MDGWTRSMEWKDTGLPWVMPSPNMPTFETAVVYPGGCLVEGTKLSEGRGTTRPFELWGAPGLDVGPILTLDLHGVSLRAVEFTPTFQKHAGRTCSGVQVHVTDPWVFRPYEAYLRMLAAVLPQLPTDGRWRTEDYEFVSDRPAIDLLTGIIIGLERVVQPSSTMSAARSGSTRSDGNRFGRGRSVRRLCRLPERTSPR